MTLAGAAPDASAPIGVFDSGLGGLSVLRHLRAALPGERFAYVADSAHAPYGPQPPEAVLERSRRVTDFLVRHAGAKAVVIACNTATAAAADALRAEHPIPIVAMEPGVKPAAAATRSGVIGIMATRNTLLSARFEGLVRRFAAGVAMVSSPCPGLVELIEAGQAGGSAARAAVSEALAPMLARGADVVVLGCTHYPFAIEAIRGRAGPDVAIIDTGPAVARQLARRLREAALCAPEGQSGGCLHWTTGDPRTAEAAAERLCGAPHAFSRLDA